MFIFWDELGVEFMASFPESDTIELTSLSQVKRDVQFNPIGRRLSDEWVPVGAFSVFLPNHRPLGGQEITTPRDEVCVENVG